VSAYGVRGWIKVQPHSPQADVLLAASRWWLAPPSREARDPRASEPLDVTTSRRQGAAIVAALAGIDDRTAAEAWRGATVCVPRSAFPAPEEDEYYWVDLIGCLLYGEAGGAPAPIGRVTEVLDNGAHAILKVERLAPVSHSGAVTHPGPGTAAAQGAGPTDEPAGTVDPSQLAPMPDAKGRPREILVPFVAAHILGVDLGARRIDSDWPADF